MKEETAKIIEKITDEEVFEAYQDILAVNCKAHAEFIMGLLITSQKRIKKAMLLDKIKIIANFLSYKYYSFLESERKNQEFEMLFKTVNSFLIDFKKIYNEFQYLFNNGIYTPDDVADLYLYYFTLITIHNNIFETFENELKRESMATSFVSVEIPTKKTIDESIEEFNTVSKFVRELKKDNQ